MAAHEHARSNQASDIQQSAYYDRRARARILAAQTSLLATAALVLLDLRHQPGGPGNKPFAPEAAVDARTGSALVGMRLTF